MTSTPQPELVVEAELLDPGLPVPQPGDQYTIAIMRYQVLKVLQGTYNHAHLYVGHPWADLTAPEFQPGVCHRLHLTREFPDYASLLSTYDTRNGGVFFCPSFQVITGE